VILELAVCLKAYPDTKLFRRWNLQSSIEVLMFRRNSYIAMLCGLLVITAACTNKKAKNPLANVETKQPDKVLFDKAMDAMKHNRFDVARMTLQTLINTYPDSEYIARAKLAVGDSWYAEGGTASLAQAEQEYRDFETFFPNMPEAAEAQLKIANIQYQDGKGRSRLHSRQTRRRRVSQSDHAVPRQSQAGERGQTAPAGSAGSSGRARVRHRAFLFFAWVVSGLDCALEIAGGKVSSVQQGR
jgi:hypothetical protein